MPRFVTGTRNGMDAEIDGVHYVSWDKLESGCDSVLPKRITCKRDRLAECLFAESCPLCGNARVVKALDELGVGVILEGERKCHG